ncbi:inverse autotransporter beta domain-containing protein [Mesorhizobium sp. LjRoot246]|uniref:inverse autotransporter beta domain-containing protein n=1 Tax=Mesorhizobium sp. LjRoot246 TaxID=3342294 RepID=UPI003ECF28B7
MRAGYRRSLIARHLWKTTALTTLALGLSGLTAHADPNGLWQPQIRAIVGADNNGGNAALEGFIPLKQTAESVLFLDVRAKHDFKDSFGQDVGLGIRRIVNPDLMVGGYAYLNVENYNSNQFTSATLGAEAITSHFDAHVNVYLPIKGDHTDHSTSSTLSMVSNQLMEQISVLDHRDYAAWGIEGEIGAQVPVNLPDKHSLRLDIGGYHFEDPHGDDGSVTGAKAGFEYTIGDVFGSSTELVFAGEVRNDNRDDTQFAGSVRLNIPFNPGHGSDNAANGADSGPEPVYPVSEGLRKRVNERVRGDIGVRIQSQTLSGGTTTRVAINAATNAAFGKFYYADGGLAGAGTLADPTTLDDAVAKAGSGFVVALGGAGNITTAGTTLADGQTVIGGGESVTAKLFGGGTGTFNLGGSDGTIQGTNVANPVITLGNGNTLNGITITGGGDGILGNNVTGTKLTKVTVDGAGGNGAEFTGNSTNVTASDFTAKNNGLDGLHIEGDGTYNFTGTTLLQHNADDGLDVTGKGTYTFATVNALDNNDAGITVKGTGGSITITGGQVSGNKALGDDGVSVFIDPITAHVVLDSISQSGGTSGVVLENVSGSFTVNGATTISNTTGPAIAISDSPAAIRFGDINITSPGGDGMSFAGVNAAVVAGNIVISGLGVGTGLDFSGAKTNFTAQSLNIIGTGAAGSIGIDLASPSAGGATIIITNGGAIAGVDTGVRFGIAGSLANSANAEFSFGGGSIAGITASLDARGLNQTLGHYAFGSTTFTGPQLFDTQNVIFVGASATGTGSGSSLLDLASIATADANTDADAIFVLVNRGTDIDDTDGFSLTAGQTLASFGNGRTFSLGGIPVNVTGDNVTHTGAVSDAGGAATLTNSGAGDVVTLANNGSLLDFNISGGSANGIHGSGVSNVTLSGVTVSGAGLNGLLFDGVNSVTANNLSSSGNTDAGLSIQGDGTYAFNGTTMLSDNGDNGLFIVGDGTYAFQTLNASGNSGFGVNVLSTTGTFSTTDGTISGNGAAGAVLLGGNLDVTLTSLTQDGGGIGAMFAGVSGNFAVSGATTVSNTILGGIGISDSTADFTFGAVDISDITAPGGIGIYVQNSGGAVTFGGPVTLTHIDSEGILAVSNAGALTFSGPVSMTDPGDGITLVANSGAVSFGGAVTIDQPFFNGINVIGANGVISFSDIDITDLCNCSTALDLSGSSSTFTAATLDVSGSSGGSSIGIDLSGTNGGSVTIGSGVITDVDTGVQMGTNGAAGTTANTIFSFGAAGGASISGVTASLDMRGLSPGSGTYAFNSTVLNGPQLFDIANVIYVGSANTGLGDGSSVNDLINAAAADDLTTDASTIFVLVKTASIQTTDTDANGFTLADSQSIVSFANGGTVTLGGPPANVTGTHVVAGATQADPFGFGGATLNNAAGSTIDLANGNFIENLTVSSSGFAVDGLGSAGATINGVTISAATIGLWLDGTTGTVTANNLTIQSASQTGIALVASSATVNFTGNTTITGAASVGLFANNFDGIASFDDLDITGGGYGVSIRAGSTGTLTFGTGSSITNTGNAAFDVVNSSPHVTYNGTIDQAGPASAVNISFLTGGSATFGGKITASTGAAAIALANNTGTISFNGAVDLTANGGNGIYINNNAGPVTFSGLTTVTMGPAATAGIKFSGTNANVSFGTTTINNVGASQTGIDFSGSSTTAGFGVTTITGTGDLTSRGIDLSSTTGNKVITFQQGSKIDNLGVGVELASDGTTATSANANFTFGDGDSIDGLESFIIAASGGYTVNTVGLDPTKGSYDFDDVFFTGSANLASAVGAVTFVSQSGGFIAAGTIGNLSTGVSTMSLAAADALTGAQNFAFVGTINLGATTFTLDSGQTIAGFGNNSAVSTGTIQPANVHGNLGATGGNITGDEAVVSGTANLMQLLGDNAVRNTAFDFSGATGAAFLIDQSAVGFSNAGGSTIEGVTIGNVAVGQTAIKVAGLNSNLSVINNNINVAGTLLDVNGGTGTISVSRGFLPNAGPAGTLTGGGINIANRTGGSVTFTDQVTINGGVAISGGSGAAAVNFNGGLAITTSTATGFSLAGLNSLAVANAGSTTIAATGQTALSLQGTVNAGGVHFDSVTSTNAGTQGVLISGASGGGVDLDAVTVTTSNGAGIEILNSTGNYTFGNTTIDNSSSFGRGANFENAAGVTSAIFDGTLAITTATGTGLRVVGGATPANTSVSFTGTGIKNITALAGEAVDITSANVNGTLTSTSATFGAGHGVNLQNLIGTLNLGVGTLNNLGAGAAFNVGSGTDLSGGNATISYAGNIVSNGSGAAVSILELTGGSVTLSGNLTDTNAAGGGQIVVANINNGTAATVTFSGATKQIQSGATDGVNLVGNPNGTIDFSTDGLAINTTSGTGFHATGGGTISVAGATNTITSTGNALSLDAVTVGSGINFNSVSTSGGVTTGIGLTNVASLGGAINLGTVDLQGINSRGVDVTGTLGAELNFNALGIGLTSTTAVAFDLNGATINAAVRANDFDVINSVGAGSSIGVDLRGATGGQIVRLGDAVAGGASSSISGVNTGVFLDSATNLAFTYGDGESTTDKNSTIGAAIGIDASSAPTLGTYNFQDVNFAASPGLGFGVGKIYFVGASATGDGTGRDQSNLATLSTAEAASVTSDVLVLVNDGGTITAAGSGADNTLVLSTGEQVRGFGNGNINLAMSVPSTIQLANNNISIVDATPNGAATLTTNAGSNAITLGASGNFIDGFILDGSPAGAARGIKDNSFGASGTIISHMTIRNFATAGIEITPSTSTGIDNVTFAGNATDVIVNALDTSITNVSSTGATGIAFDIRNATGTTTLSNLNVTTASTGTGIVFGGASGPQGTITGTNVDVTGGAGGGIKVTGGNAAITFDAASFVGIPDTSSGTAVTIATRTGGSFVFAGSVVANGTASGIVIAPPTGPSNVSFTGTVDLGTTTTMTGTAVSINNGGFLSSTVSFANIDIVTSNTTGFSAGNGGTVTVTTGTISSTTAQAINLNGIAANVNFTSTTSTGGVNNVALTNVTGTVNLGSGALSGASGAAFLGSGGTAGVTYGGSIAKTSAGNVVSISGRTGGTVTFDGTISATASSGGIALATNTGSTINFTNSLTLTGANVAGFSATGGGTVSATGTGSVISSGTATALNVANTTIGAGNLVFQRISSSGGSANGIILNNTGTAAGNGGLHVTGTGANVGATGGGVIASKTGADLSTTQGSGIYLNNTKDVQLNGLQMSGFDNYGVYGTNVTGFTLDHTLINGANGTSSAGGSREGAVAFDGLFGTASITNSTLGGVGGGNYSYSDDLRVTNTSGTLTRLTVDNVHFGDINAAGNDALNFVASNSAVANLTVTNSFFTNAIGELLRVVANNNSTVDAVIRNNAFSNNNASAASGAGSLAIVGDDVGNATTVTYDVSHNTLKDAIGIALLVAKGNGHGTWSGTINANTIGTAGVVNSGSTQASGIKVTSNGTGSHTTLISNNIVHGTNEVGIFLQANDSQVASNGGQGVFNASIFSNTVGTPGSFSFAGLSVDVGALAGDNNIVNLVVGSATDATKKNDFSAGDPANFSDVNFSQQFGTSIKLYQNGSSGITAALVIDDDNLNPATTTTAISGTMTVSPGAGPALPPPVAP